MRLLLYAVEFRNSLEAKLGIELPSTLVFDYPSVAAIALLVSTMLAPSGEAAAPSAAQDADFLSNLLDASVVDNYGVYDLAAGGSTGSVSVDVSAIVTRQPAGIMAGGDPTR
jgi:hypothetical protein